RPQIWRESLRIAEERPWFGEGPGSYLVGFRRHPVPALGTAARWGMWTEYAHSEFLQAAAETGWAGAALWLIGLGALLSALAASADAEPAREAAAAALAAMSVQVCVDNMLQLPALAFLFFSAGALAGARPRGGRRLPRAAAILGAVLALGAWIPRALARDPARAAVLFPADPLAREDLAYRAEKEGRLAEADALWTQAAARAPFDAVYPWRRAQIAAAEGRWADAESLAAVATALEPGFLNARILRAQALVRLGRRAQARAELDEVRRIRAQPLGYVYTGYDVAVSTFDSAQFARVEALTAAPRR
ncbi:MAG: tetratricopeptide repeat protein, partial [Elusimicrobia bacterium]|nr:tetratricopeptide repeat protein [Elusimicrobiota bacterium]